MKQIAIVFLLTLCATASFAQRVFPRDITVERDIRGERYIVLGAGADTARIINNTTSGLSFNTVGVANTFNKYVDAPSYYINGNILFHLGAGAFNTFVGYYAGSLLPSGTNNSGFGTGAGALLTTGTNNTLIGRDAGGAITTTSNNTFLGMFTGATCTGKGNVAIGSFAGRDMGAVNNKLYIHNDTVTNPLIYGDFATRELTINGSVSSTAMYTAAGEDTIASVDTLTLSGTSNNILVTGTDTIVHINTTNIPDYSVIYILFSGTASGVGVTNGSNLKLSGDFGYTPDDTMILQRRGANFYELSRSGN